ncbi:hypothetical protein [Clostridium algidicarnis]|uniref:hypothetical protein n=1 Tax=Clostridium algidicarnis TaxID=37659 RepID=UPI001C0B1730|nr:hypothetical protein [Clostridium algidicarnis]MBU3204138.1 hypothetical protein [Clostridium algidicarnis]MBU3212292.1 hypothetical protein [Clostridium algidicarnis]MBU3221203.1 hypothetical protein [Clostridium algidicarnis]
MNDKIKETEDNILRYLYENRLKSPQSLAKIRYAANLEEDRVDKKILKASLESLISKNFIKKQENRGNYKIEDEAVEYVEKIL